MPDPRVTHLWDEECVVSWWFAEHVDREQGFMWDTYLLYGPQAKWDSNNIPDPIISSGATVLGKRGQLETSIAPLLEGSAP